KRCSALQRGFSNSLQQLALKHKRDNRLMSTITCVGPVFFARCYCQSTELVVYFFQTMGHANVADNPPIGVDMPIGAVGEIFA
ncbi:MAG: hypothetical protein KJ052_19825, partial [Candidatus Hydrogenedentes bacterium]|nr:hypothetical protein [Candidatus Hydrogenedentota bacterium]